MLTALMAAVACFLACLALVTLDDPVEGRARGGRSTAVAAGVIVVSTFFVCMKLAIGEPLPGTSLESEAVPGWLALLIGALGVFTLVLVSKRIERSLHEREEEERNR